MLIDSINKSTRNESPRRSLRSTTSKYILTLTYLRISSAQPPQQQQATKSSMLIGLFSEDNYIFAEFKSTNWTAAQSFERSKNTYRRVQHKVNSIDKLLQRKMIHWDGCWSYAFFMDTLPPKGLVSKEGDDCCWALQTQKCQIFTNFLLTIVL
jgi:hypothetical protein